MSQVIDSLRGLGERTAAWETSWVYRRWAVFGGLVFCKTMIVLTIVWVREVAPLVQPLAWGGLLYIVTVYALTANSDDKDKRRAAVAVELGKDPA